jgi:tripeptidyl-peptidase-1
MLLNCVSILALALSASARNARRGWHVHERRDDAPTGFAYTGQAQPDQVIQFRVALTKSNPNGLIQALYNVSDPDHQQYGQHLSRDDVGSLF